MRREKSTIVATKAGMLFRQQKEWGQKPHITQSFNVIPRSGQGPLPDPATFWDLDKKSDEQEEEIIP